MESLVIAKPEILIPKTTKFQNAKIYSECCEAAALTPVMFLGVRVQGLGFGCCKML